MQNTVYGTQSPIPSNNVRLGEHVSYLNTELQKLKDAESKFSSEIRGLKCERDLIKGKIRSFCESVEKRVAGSALSSPLLSCWSGTGVTSQGMNTAQRLDGMFNYVEKLHQLVEQQDKENFVISNKVESVTRENAILRDIRQKVDPHFTIGDAVRHLVSRYLFGNAVERKRNSHEENELIQSITNYFNELFEDQNKRLEKQEAHIQDLETSLGEKNSKLIGIAVVRDSELRRLQRALHDVNQIIQAQVHVLEVEGKQMEYKLNHMYESLLRYSKQYSANNINLEISNDSVLKKKLKQLKRHDNKTVALTRNGAEFAQDDFIAAFQKVTHMVKRYAQTHSFEEVSKRADVVNTQRNLQLICQLEEELTHYEEKINKFQDTRESKVYLHLQEMIMRTVEKLDYIESQNKEEVMNKRKKAILRAITLMKKLEERVNQKKIFS